MKAEEHRTAIELNQGEVLRLCLASSLWYTQTPPKGD